MKGAATVAELAKAVAILKTRDSRRAREVKALQGDIIILQNRLPRRIPIVGTTGPEIPQVSPATNSTDSFLPFQSATAGTGPLQRVRSFFKRFRS